MPLLTTAVGINRPSGSRGRAPLYVQFEPKDNDEVAHQQLPRIFAASFEARVAQPKLRDFEANKSLSFRIVRLEASHTAGGLAREVKAAHMTYLQAVHYLAIGARVMCTWNGWSINLKASNCRS